MKTQSIFVLFCLVLCLQVNADERITGKLQVGSTALSQGEIKFGEKLTTHDGVQLAPGAYRIAIAVNSLGEAQFVLSPFKVERPTDVPAIQKNAVNKLSETAVELQVGATVTKNLLVKGIASNLEGAFVLQNITPSEAVLSFNSKQFEATAMLGRPLDSKLVDLVPSFVSVEDPADCGTDCVEGNLKVVVRNEGNASAKGKWNITLQDPRTFVGTLTDVPPGGEKTIVSISRIKFPCCNPLYLDVEVHADFYNKDSEDSNDSNNSKRFTLKLKQ